jgi:hypothetical protein
VREDRLEAYVWLTLALAGFPPEKAAARDLAAEQRAVLVLRMTPAEIDEGERRVAAWPSVRS